MKRQAICIMCGTVFTADRVTQKYCSSSCRRLAHRRGMNDHAKPSARAKRKALRVFNCVKCGRRVYVTTPSDKRTKFCSAHCERLYWKHSNKVKSLAVQRTFHCRMCGRAVNVTDSKDRRTTFCSAACRTQWFSLHRATHAKQTITRRKHI